MTRKSLQERFDEKYIPVTESGCWLWTGATGGIGEGYGKIWVNGGLSSAHRISYELHIGPIPDGLCCLHKCDVSFCVNPSHLFLGTNADNSMDMSKKGRCADTRGELNGSAKLTDAEVISIRSDQRSERVIARDYEISSRSIGGIKRRERWSHL